MHDFSTSGDLSQLEVPTTQPKPKRSDDGGGPQALLGQLAEGGQQLANMLQQQQGGLGEVAAGLVQQAGGNSVVADLMGKGGGGEALAKGELGPQETQERLASGALKKGLEAPTRTMPFKEQIEGELGIDVSNIQVHAGGPAKEAAEAVGGKAFAVANQVFFADADPDKATVLHELSHVMAAGGHQEGGELSNVPGQLPVGQDNSSQELQADSVANDPTQLTAQADKGGGGGPTTLHRKVDLSGTGKDYSVTIRLSPCSSPKTLVFIPWIAS